MVSTSEQALCVEFPLNGRFYDADEGLFIHHEANNGAINLCDTTNDAGIRDDLHTFLEVFLKFLYIFLLFYLRSNKKKVKNNDDQKWENHSNKASAGGYLEKNVCDGVHFLVC